MDVGNSAMAVSLNIQRFIKMRCYSTCVRNTLQFIEWGSVEMIQHPEIKLLRELLSEFEEYNIYIVSCISLVTLKSGEVRAFVFAQLSIILLNESFCMNFLDPFDSNYLLLNFSNIFGFFPLAL